MFPLGAPARTACGSEAGVAEADFADHYIGWCAAAAAATATCHEQWRFPVQQLGCAATGSAVAFVFVFAPALPACAEVDVQCFAPNHLERRSQYRALTSKSSEARTTAFVSVAADGGYFDLRHARRDREGLLRATCGQQRLRFRFRIGARADPSTPATTSASPTPPR